MKKILLVIVVIAMVSSVLGCSNESAENNQIKDYVNVGDNVETTKKSEIDGKEHKVTYKITKIEKNVNEVNKQIEDFNTSGKGEAIEALSNEKLQYIIAEYEVLYPKEFPQDGEYGITDVTLDFSIVNLEGGDTFSTKEINYKGLEKTWQIGYDPRGYDFYSGDTYQGKIVFIMVKDYDKYFIKEKSAYIKGV